MKKIVLVFFLISSFCFAQENNKDEYSKKDFNQRQSMRTSEVFFDLEDKKSLSDNQLLDYEKQIRNGSKDEEIAFKLGMYYVEKGKKYHGTAKRYFLIGAEQNSPRCLYHLIVSCFLRPSDLTDLESYDKLKELEKKNVPLVHAFVLSVEKQKEIMERIELKRKGIFQSDDDYLREILDYDDEELFDW